MADELPPGSILVIDDCPEQPRALLVGLGNTVQIIHPDDMTLPDLQNAHLVLVDHDLKNHDWPSRASYPLACQPLDGMALGHLLLGHFRAPQNKHFPPTAVGLLSAELEIITPGFEMVPEHIAARTSGLHWAFWKQPKPDDVDQLSLPDRISIFATAVMDLPKQWNQRHHRDHLRRLLGLKSNDKGSWELVGVDQALSCRPPLHELATWTSGLAFIRWLSQRVLPYPTFLVGVDALAVHLGVQPAWLRSNLKTGTNLNKVFEEAEYCGILSNFVGRRWWIAGVDSILQNAGQEVPFSRAARYDWLSTVGSETPIPLERNHTLVLNERMLFTGATALFDDCVRLQLDDWPSFAKEPWTTIELARKISLLGGSVHPDDEESMLDEGSTE